MPDIEEGAEPGYTEHQEDTALKIIQMKINGIREPLGFDLENVRLSWKVEDTASKKPVTTLVEAAEDPQFRNLLCRIEGDPADSLGTLLPVSLNPKTRYFVRVKVKGDAGDEAEGTTFFETGRRDLPFAADWIGPEEDSEVTHPILKKTFDIEGPVQRARLYVCGVGLFEAYLNGKKIGDEYLTPYLSDYETRLQVITFDAAPYLQEGSNTLEILLGPGWYMGTYGLGLQKNNFGSRLAGIAELDIRLQDGRKFSVLTDRSWTFRGSDIESSGIYDGEVINRLLYADKENPERPVEVIRTSAGGTKNLDKSHLHDRLSLPVRVLEKLSPAEILHTASGETIADFGQNFAGFVSFGADFPAGTRITMTAGEILQNGAFYHGNYRDARTQFVYVSDGRAETVRAHFTFSGFRYVKVEGWPGELQKEDLLGCVLSSDLSRTGRLSTGNAKINRLYENTLWGERSNFIDIPSDCPQRSERLGWTGDAQVFSRAASLHLDTEAFFHKFCVQLRDEQNKIGGAIPNYVPNIGHRTDACALWGDAGTIIPMNLYEFYGSVDALREAVPMMQDWVEWIRRQDDAPEHEKKRLFDFGFSFGDWLALDGPTKESFKGRTDEAFIATCCYFGSAGALGKAFRILADHENDARKKKEYQENAERYGSLAEEIRQAAKREYFTPSGRCAVDTQTGLTLALHFGICPDREVTKRQMQACLLQDLHEIKGGFAGAPLLCQTLAENGMTGEAYDLLFRETFPSWLYEVNLGATTVWERWNSVLPDGTISPQGMNSLNHYAYGSVMEFVYAFAGGIRPLEPGWRKALIAPCPDVRFGHVDCSYDSKAGRYACSWRIEENGDLAVKIRIPFGATARVILPEDPEKRDLMLPAGEYEYTYTPVHDCRKIFSWDTKLSRAAGVPEALSVLAACTPPLAGMCHDPEMGAHTFRDIASMSYLPIRPEDLKKAVEELENITVPVPDIA